MQNAGWQMRYLDQAVRKQHFAPLLYSMGLTGTMGGVGAFTGFEAANALTTMLSDKTIMQHLYDEVGMEDDKKIADTLFYGLPGFLGFSIQNQVAAPFSDIGQDAARLMSFAMMDRARALGAGMGDLIDHWGATGENPLTSRPFIDHISKALLPKNFQRAVATTQNNCLRSLHTGTPIIKNLTPAERFTYVVLGLNPTRIDKGFRVSQELWHSEQKRREAISMYGKAWFEADAEKDYGRVKIIMQKILADGVDMGNVIKSLKRRQARGREDLIESRFSPQAVYGYRNVGL